MTVTATDADNDHATGHVDVWAQIIFHDDGPIGTNASASGTVDEGDLRSVALLGTDTFGSVTDTGPVTTGGAAGSLNALVNFGADGPSTTPFQFVGGASAALAALGIHSHGTLVDTATLSNGDHTLTASASGIGTHAVFSLTINNNGSWTFTDLGPIDHPLGDNTEAPVTLNLSGLVQAVDGDGDSTVLSNDLMVTVADERLIWWPGRPPARLTRAIFAALRCAARTRLRWKRATTLAR